jgi:lipopolysaccharide biosynthesis glycosyltransferase
MVRLSANLASRTHSRAWLMHSLLEANSACSQPEIERGSSKSATGPSEQANFSYFVFFRLFSDDYHPNHERAISKSFN